MQHIHSPTLPRFSVWNSCFFSCCVSAIVSCSSIEFQQTKTIIFQAWMWRNRRGLQLLRNMFPKIEKSTAISTRYSDGSLLWWWSRGESNKSRYNPVYINESLVFVKASQNYTWKIIENLQTKITRKSLIKLTANEKTIFFLPFFYHSESVCLWTTYSGIREQGITPWF